MQTDTRIAAQPVPAKGQEWKGVEHAATARAGIEGLSDAEAAQEVARILANAGHEAERHSSNAACATALRKHIVGISRAWDQRYAPDGEGAGIMIPVECLTMAAAADMLDQPVPVGDREAISAKLLGEVMQDAWGEICDDSGAHPLDINRVKGVTWYSARHWTDLIALRLNERLATLSPETVGGTNERRTADGRRISAGADSDDISGAVGDRGSAGSADTAVTVGDFVLVPQPFVDFLCGISPWEGVWFGDLHPRGAFWWRNELSKFAAAPKATQSDTGEA